MRRFFALFSVAMLALSAPASAQRPSASSVNLSPELGMDAGVTFGLGSNSLTVVSIPIQQLRMGFFVSPALSVEPTLALISVSGGGSTLTTYDVGVGLLYHFSPNRAANQFYVRPFANVEGTSGAGSSSNTIVGIGGGLKVPLANRIASRFEANIAHSNGNNAIGLLAGLSFYTR